MYLSEREQRGTEYVVRNGKVGALQLYRTLAKVTVPAIRGCNEMTVHTITDDMI